MNSYRYDTFNARYLSFEEVANTFIPYQIFDQLITNNHTLLMGPRGCGKTTLLKMLTPKAIHHYNSKPGVKKIILPFIGIYIPSDKQWEKQLLNFGQRFDDNIFVTTISREIVNANILISVINTFIYIIDNNEIDDISMQVRCCKKIITSLKIEKPVSPTFVSIVHSLKKRISEINVLVNKYDAGKLSADFQYPEYFFSNFLDLVIICCDEFQEAYQNLFNQIDTPKRWALCFDELEIAPEWLQKDLITNHLRSRDQSFLFKLTTTPLVDAKYWLNTNGSVTSPSQNEDYKIIRNWVFNQESKESWRKFSRLLFQSLITRELGFDCDPDQIFGNTQTNINTAIIAESKDRHAIAKEPYTEGSVEWNIFKQLAERDETFQKFLNRKEILAYNPLPSSDKQKDTVFRKIKLIVFFRYYFKRGLGLRSRKNVELYSGVPLIYELADGNPRTLLNLFESFRVKLGHSKSGVQQILISAQARIIKEVCSLKLENIKNHPDANIEIENGQKLNLGTVLENVGEYFFKALIKDSFTMDPVTTFYIDTNLKPEVVKLLKFGLNLGAIQYLDPKQDMSDEDVYNKLYRLNFTLFPVFNLPVREYGSVRLSNALPQYSIQKRRGNANPDSSQSELF